MSETDQLADESKRESQYRSVSGAGSRLKSGHDDGPPVLSHMGFLSIW